MLKIKDDVDLKVLKKFYSSEKWRKIRNNLMNPIIIVRVCKKCEKENNKMTIGDKYRNEINNKELSNDEIAKTMANALKELTEALGSFNEEKIKEILKQSVKPTLSEAERIILENVDKEYKWIARDENKNIFIYSEKPDKKQYMWACMPNVAICFKQYNHLFQFITWEDEEAYNIEELLKQ